VHFIKKINQKTQFWAYLLAFIQQMFTIYAEAVFVINFELAPAPFSFGKYLFQIFLLGIQFFKVFKL